MRRKHPRNRPSSLKVKGSIKKVWHFRKRPMQWLCGKLKIIKMRYAICNKRIFLTFKETHMNYRIVLLVGLVSFIAGINANEPAKEDPTKQIKRAYSFNGFEGVKLGGAVDAIVTIGDTFEIQLEGRKQDIEAMVVEKDGTTLVIRPKADSWCIDSVQGRHEVNSIGGRAVPGDVVGDVTIDMRRGDITTVVNGRGNTIVSNGNAIACGAGAVACSNGRCVRSNGPCVSTADIGKNSSGQTDCLQPVRATIQLPLVVYLAALYGSSIDAKGLKGRDLKVDATRSGKVTVAGSCNGLTIKAAESSAVDATDLQAGDATIKASLSSTVNVPNIQGEDVEIVAELSSKVTLGGRCKEVEARAAHSSTIDARKLQAEKARVNGSFTAIAHVQAIKRLRVTSSFGAQITYCGSPAKVTKDSSFAGTIHSRATCE